MYKICGEFTMYRNFMFCWVFNFCYFYLLIYPNIHIYPHIYVYGQTHNVLAHTHIQTSCLYEVEFSKGYLWDPSLSNSSDFWHSLLLKLLMCIWVWRFNLPFISACCTYFSRVVTLVSSFWGASSKGHTCNTVWVAQIESDGFFQKRGHQVSWIEKERWIWEELGEGVFITKIHCTKFSKK